jgi:hypothetical protein
VIDWAGAPEVTGEVVELEAALEAGVKLEVAVEATLEAGVELDDTGLDAAELDAVELGVVELEGAVVGAELDAAAGVDEGVVITGVVVVETTVGEVYDICVEVA